MTNRSRLPTVWRAVVTGARTASSLMLLLFSSRTPPGRLPRQRVGILNGSIKPGYHSARQGRQILIRPRAMAWLDGKHAEGDQPLDDSTDGDRLGADALRQPLIAQRRRPIGLLRWRRKGSANRIWAREVRSGSWNETARAVERCAQGKPIGTTESASD
jgi:hypothetical protein